MTTKVLKVAACTLGVGLLVSPPFTAPLLGVGWRVGCAVTGILLTLASSVAWVALDIFVPPHHDMKNHMYKPSQCEGGKLYYEGDVPILSLESDDPFTAGRAHGYLCADAIHRLTQRFGFVIHTLGKQPRVDALPKTLAALRQCIPSEYLREIEGVVEGYNQWAHEHPWWRAPKTLTVDDVLLIHLEPEACHFQPVACSAIVDRDPQDGFVFARNMDWPSFGLAGAYSLVIHRKHDKTVRNTVEVGIPGFIGTLTGMNGQGLSMAMNVCAGNTRELRGMPAVFYNRACLEHCGSVKDVEAFARKYSPLGPYHLTVADLERAESIHFYQSPTGNHSVRRWQQDKPLATLNCRYQPESYGDMHHSVERQEVLEDFFQHRANRHLEETLALPFVNNGLTTHRVVMEPQSARFRVAFDNAFAGRAPLHEVPTQELLPRPVTLKPAEGSWALKLFHKIFGIRPE